MAKAKVAGYCAAFDLSAATDRLPLMVQMTIMERAIGSQATTAWSALMTGRDYYLLPDQDGHVIEPQAIRYAVGQPMGAYSSWGMLAVTHHYIVQYCAARVGLRPDDQT